MGHVLSQPGINVFEVSLGMPYKKPEDSTLVHCKQGYGRLFPSGSGILITDSCLLQSPKIIVRFLRWFRKYVLVTKNPFTWQFFTRPKFPTWTAELGRDRLYEEPRDEATVFQNIYLEFKKLVNNRDMEASVETPKPKAPYHSAPAIPGYDLDAGLKEKRSHQEILGSNDDRLVNWFGDVTLSQVDKKRRFIVLYDGPRETMGQWKKDWGYVCEKSPAMLETHP